MAPSCKTSKIKVIHICGYSGVGKNFLLSKIRKLGTKTKTEFTDNDRYLLDRFGIDGKFCVCGPTKEEDPNTPTYQELENDIYEKVGSGEFDTVIHHWQHPSHIIYYLIRQHFQNVSQKTFIIWRDPRSHLVDLLTKRNHSYYDTLSVNRLKELFDTDVIQLLRPVSMRKDMLENYKPKHYCSTRIDLDDLPAFNVEYEIVTPVTETIYAGMNDQIQQILK